MFRRNFFAIILLTLPFFHASSSYAKKNQTFAQVAPAVQTSLIVDINTGKVLHSKNNKARIYPASLTKLMTLKMLFEAIKSGKLNMHSKLLVSASAEKMRPCKLGLMEGEYITVKEAILGLIVRSANDAAVVVAENLAGSEARFARMMTARAHQLGMKHTTFKNASGWHDPEQKTTAIDLAKLALSIRQDHKDLYPLFAMTSFKFRGKVINGHNHVTKKYVGAEGLKTGYTRPAGYNLVTIASRNNHTLLGVLTGNETAKIRDKKMMQLLDKHFEMIASKKTKKRPGNLKVAAS